MGQALPAQEPARLGAEPGRTLARPRRRPPTRRPPTPSPSTCGRAGSLRQYSIDVAFVNGTAELNGVVADQLQREEALRVVQGVPGVGRVLDHLRLAENPIIPVQAAVPAPVPVAPPPALPSIALGLNGVPAEPAPLFAAPAGRRRSTSTRPSCRPTPGRPTRRTTTCRAWAYPTAYPYNAWPFIGRSTLPKVPLGWRSVKLGVPGRPLVVQQGGLPARLWRVRYW